MGHNIALVHVSVEHVTYCFRLHYIWSQTIFEFSIGDHYNVSFIS